MSSLERSLSLHLHAGSASSFTFPHPLASFSNFVLSPAGDYHRGLSRDSFWSLEMPGWSSGMAQSCSVTADGLCVNRVYSAAVPWAVFCIAVGYVYTVKASWR